MVTIVQFYSDRISVLMHFSHYGLTHVLLGGINPLGFWVNQVQYYGDMIIKLIAYRIETRMLYYGLVVINCYYGIIGLNKYLPSWLNPWMPSYDT